VVLLSVVAAQILARLAARRSETVDLREQCNALVRSAGKREAEAEATASCAGREESPAMGKGEAVIGRPRL
jgi:hypothetical protein